MSAPPRRGRPPARRGTGRRSAPVRPLDPLVGTEVELEIGAVGTGGVCVARLGGRVVFVRHALPGERVRALVTDGTEGRPLRADAVDILTASPDRVEPPCPWAGPGRCGGCDWQHAALPAQRALKAGLVREQLRRLAGLDGPQVDDLVVAPLLGDDGGLSWRTRVHFAVDGAGRAGLRRSRSHDVEPVDWCRIATPRVTEVGVTGPRWEVAGVEVIAASGPGADRALVITPRGREEVTVPPLPLSTAVMRVDGAGRVEAVRGRPGVREHAVGRSWRVSGSGFWQVHPGAAETFGAAVLAALQPKEGESALDLYSGVGLFAGALAGPLGVGGRVTAVEADPQAAADAEHNLSDLVATVRVLRGRVEDVLQRSGLRRADLVVLDPPRTGAGAEVTRWIASLRPRRVAYLSCDPASLARDIVTFAEEGYEPTALRAFDAFPMTQHVETLALLEPRVP